MTVRPDPDDVREFFAKTTPDQIHLCAIDPEGRIPLEGQDFGTDVKAAVEWALNRNNEGLNVYYTVNRVRSGLHKKPSKPDIEGVRFAHVDIDPPKEASKFTQEEKEAAYQALFAAKPCIIIWSGNGWQGLWRMEDGISTQLVEQANRGLIKGLGGDVGTHDVSRLLRVPGLVNYPDVNKRNKGREPALSGIALEDDGSVTALSRILEEYPAPYDATTSAPSRPNRGVVGAGYVGDWPVVTSESLGLTEHTLLRKLIDAPDGLDRSRDTLAMACEGLRFGLTKAQIMGVLLNPVNAVSAHCLDEAKPARAAQRAIERALEEEDVMRFFRAHEREREQRLASGEAEAAEAGMALTKVWTLETMLQECVYIEESSQVADTTRLGYLLSLSDFRNATAASMVTKEVPAKNGSARKVKVLLANEWLAHPDRTTVSTRTFKAGEGPIASAPDGRSALNSWRGYRTGVAPIDWAERAQPFVEHVRLLFQDDADRFLNWVAHIAQRPGELPSTAWLHISRKTGTGRNLIAKILGRVFVGYAALAFPLTATLRDGFNAGLAGKVLAVVDEIDEGHSSRKYQLAQELKQLVTEERRTINQKFLGKYEEQNSCRWLIFSNSPAALPLEDEDRRFNVVQFDGEPQEAAYFEQLYALAEDPAFIASVMKFLLERDISSFNKGERAIMTPAKADLLDRTRSEDDQTLREIVQRWPTDVITASEVHAQLGEHRITGPALRYALDRAGIVRLRQWKEVCGEVWDRRKVTAYSLRNHEYWKAANTALLRREIGRATREEKDAALYGNDESD